MSLLTTAQTDLEAVIDSGEVTESATYTPADTEVEAFSFDGLFGAVDYLEELDRHIYSDVASCKILNRDLQAGGLTEPVAQKEAQAGDTITRVGPDDQSQIWTVTDKKYDPRLKCWDLVIEKDLRAGAAIVG